MLLSMIEVTILVRCGDDDDDDDDDDAVGTAGGACRSRRKLAGFCWFEAAFAMA